ncbi:MAG: deoxyribonuclease IV [Prevotellaceae bacterium]|jgi:deoxyribonuclease-4|nr:deoxyribonuclease IV [Prevotellaceae bacterium]
MRYIGPHVSASGGVENAPFNAAAVGANAFALFTKNQRQWTAPPLSPQSIQLFTERCVEYGFSPDVILPHDSYLINPGHPDPFLLNQSRLALLDEMKRCQDLGLKMLNLHPGGHLNLTSVEECLSIVAESINFVLERTLSVTAVIENTAGQGTNVGFEFEHIAAIIDQVKDQSRVGVCIDTCHAFTAGYDFTTSDGYRSVWEKFDQTVGFRYLKAIHLNDSKKAFGSRVDRHESIGVGFLGVSFFKRLINDQRFAHIPLILETPDDTLWPQEIKMLQNFITH